MGAATMEQAVAELATLRQQLTLMSQQLHTAMQQADALASTLAPQGAVQPENPPFPGTLCRVFLAV